MDWIKHILAGNYMFKLLIETLEQGVKYDVFDVVLVSLLLNLHTFHN